MRKIWWWVSAPFAAALMFMASSQPYFTVYKPWSWTRENVLETGKPSSFDLPVKEIDNPAGLPRTAEVELRGFERIEDDNTYGVDVPEGFDGWILFTQWKAPEDALLSGCEIWFTGSDGRRYQQEETLIPATPGKNRPKVPDEIRKGPGCTPRMQSGPRYTWPEGELENRFPRPEEWENLINIVMPDGVQPTEFHFAWGPPHYVTLELPASMPFVEELLADSSSGSDSFAGAAPNSSTVK